MDANKLNNLTVAEYIALEKSKDTRYEYAPLHATFRFETMSRVELLFADSKLILCTSSILRKAVDSNHIPD